MPLDRERKEKDVREKIEIACGCACNDGKDEAIDTLARVIVIMQRDKSVSLHHILKAIAVEKGEIFAAGIKSIIDQKR